MSETTELLASRNDNFEFLQTLIDSKKLPGHVKTKEDAFTIQVMGRELGFPTMQAFHFIIPIQGKLTLSAKAIGALLRKGKIMFSTIEDGVWVFKDGTTSDVSARDALNAAGEMTIERPIDRRTTIHFDRKGVVEKCSFTWKDAEKQELTKKDNWTRMPKLFHWAV